MEHLNSTGSFGLGVSKRTPSQSGRLTTWPFSVVCAGNSRPSVSKLRKQWTSKRGYRLSSFIINIISFTWKSLWIKNVITVSPLFTQAALRALYSRKMIWFSWKLPSSVCVESWFRPFLVPRRLSFDENVRAKEGGKETIVSRSPLPCEKRSAWGGGCFRPWLWKMRIISQIKHWIWQKRIKTKTQARKAARVNTVL